MVGDESRALERECNAGKMEGSGVGEDVALGERPRLGVAMAQAGDAMVEQPPARVQQPREHTRVLIDAVGPDVLDHTNARDRVELIGAHQVAIVTQANLDTILQTRLRHAPARELRLIW